MDRPSAKHSLHSQSKRTPKQHLIVMKRTLRMQRVLCTMRKVLRLLCRNSSEYDYVGWYNYCSRKIR